MLAVNHPRYPLVCGLQALCRRIAQALAAGSAICLLALLALVCANVAGRALDMPLRGAVESSGLIGGLSAALALALAQVHNNHVTGGVAFGTLPRWLRWLLDILANLVAFAFFALAAWELVDLSLFSLEIGESVEGLGQAYPWLIMVSALGFAGQALIMLLGAASIALTGASHHDS